MKRRRTRAAAAVTTLALMSLIALATLASAREGGDAAAETVGATAPSANQPSLLPAAGGPTVDCGITVGKAKLYDQRTLRHMLNDVTLTLAAAHYVDPAAAIAALGRFQGSSSQLSWFQASVSGPPGLASQQAVSGTQGTTAASTTTVTKTDSTGTSVTSTSNPAGQTSTATQALTTTTPAITPLTYTAAPAMTGSTFPLPQLNSGLSAFDVLTQQTELAYEAFNLSMLLQGAMSDRFEMSEDGGRVFRSQAVVGFQVSLDPSRASRNAVAEVTVTVRNQKAGEQPPSLVALLPRDKTYNVATIRQGSKAFSIGAVAKLISLGVGGGSSSQSVYYIQDVDTVALERIAPEELGGHSADSLRFGWQFRPVLEQTTVSSGPRQVFAVLSLPSTELEDWRGNISVETHWRAYDRKSKTAGRIIPSSVSYQQPYKFTVPAAKTQNKAVAAEIDTISWHYAGGERLVVTVDGHIPVGTRVALGDLMIDGPQSGLILQTEQRVTFSAPIQKLAFCDAELIDPFGVSTPVLRHSEVKTGQGLKITKVNASAEGPKTKIVVQVFGRDNLAPVALDKNAPEAATHHVLMIVGGRVFGLGDDQITSKADVLNINFGSTSSLSETLRSPFRLVQTKTGKELWVTVPTDEYERSPVVRVFDPLWGETYRDEYEIAYDDSTVPGVADVKTLAAGKDRVRLALNGSHLAANGVQLRVGNKRVPAVAAETSESLAVFDVDRTDIVGVRQLIVEANGPGSSTSTASLHVIAMLPVPADLLWRPRALKIDPITLGGDGRVHLQGAHFENVAAARWKGQNVTYDIDKVDTTNLYVNLPSEATKSEGEANFDLLGISGEIEACKVTVTKAPPK